MNMRWPKRKAGESQEKAVIEAAALLEKELDEMGPEYAAEVRRYRDEIFRAISEDPRLTAREVLGRVRKERP